MELVYPWFSEGALTESDVWFIYFIGFSLSLWKCRTIHLVPCLTIVNESSASGIILSGFWMFLAYSLLDTLVWFVMYYLRKKNITLKKGEIETLSIWIVSWIYVTIVIVHHIYTKSLSPVSIPIVFWFQELFVFLMSLILLVITIIEVVSGGGNSPIVLL